MPWLELSIRCSRRDWPRIESALEEIGALSVTLLDAEDEPILEPGPGETPLWRELSANALFEADADRRGITAVLQELAPWLDPARLAFREVADADWSRAWMDQYRPMRFGRRLWIYPSTIEPAQDADAVVVRLDPGLAFGTGTHPTTALCLAWLDGLDLADHNAGQSFHHRRDRRDFDARVDQAVGHLPRPEVDVNELLEPPVRDLHTAPPSSRPASGPNC